MKYKTKVKLIKLINNLFNYVLMENILYFIVYLDLFIVKMEIMYFMIF